MFKKGDLLKCVNNSNAPEITKDKIYEALTDSYFEFPREKVKIETDEGSCCPYCTTRFVLYQPEWIEWNGGECPVDGATLVNVKFSNGAITLKPSPAWDLQWKLSENGINVIAYQIVEPTKETKEQEQPDMVNHPPHYTKGGIECIEAIKSALTEEEFRGHCKANALKYIWREKDKGGVESIKKAIWYLNQLCELDK